MIPPMVLKVIPNTPLEVKFLEKGSTSGYLMIVLEIFQCITEGGKESIKLEVPYNGNEG
jgi:hypothetical protein